jgi:CheY-like chemotaxis protein/HPt (histidine-containing phosphotransfer) domain-containing protein
MDRPRGGLAAPGWGWISRKLAVLLAGDLTAASRPDEGSVLTLTLPLLACDPPAMPEPATQAVTIAAAHRGRALVVDDDATIRWLLQRQLEKLGFVVDAAEDGEAGLRKAGAGRQDVVLTDCHMPRMDGVVMTRAIRMAPDPGLRRIPIIGLTADVTEAQRALCGEAGMTELAIKPLTLEHLAEILGRHLGRHLGAPADPAPDTGIDTAPEAKPGTEPALRATDFDDQIYLSIFPPGDPEGEAWLRGYLEAAHQDAAELAALFDVPQDAGLATQGICRVAHRLAGASFSVGAMLLGEAGRELERAAAASRDLQGLRGPEADVRARLDSAEQAITAFLHTLPPSATPTDPLVALGV